MIDLDRSEEDLPVREGDLIADRYRVERILGIGGMGAVMAATHEQLEQHVAIKILLPKTAREPQHLKRLLREARIIARMKSEHVARVFDVGTLPDGMPFMVMELLEGVDLEAHLDLHAPLPIDEALSYFSQACEAVAEAHSLGIVHRDLKPSNMFLTTGVDRRPLIKVLDFGLSKVSIRAEADHEQSSITRPLAVLGTPNYMSPEQLRSAHDVDARADIWALGVILYELLTGEVPFRGESLADLCASIVRDPPAPLTGSLPQGLERIIVRCLQKRAKDRFPKVSALIAALAPYTREKEAIERVMRVQPITAKPPSVVVPDDLMPRFPSEPPSDVLRALASAMEEDAMEDRVTPDVPLVSTASTSISLTERAPRERTFALAALSIAIGTAALVGLVLAKQLSAQRAVEAGTSAPPMATSMIPSTPAAERSAQPTAQPPEPSLPAEIQTHTQPVTSSAPLPARPATSISVAKPLPRSKAPEPEPPKPEANADPADPERMLETR